MICPVCSREHAKMICPYCLAQQSRDSYLEFQKQYLPGVLAGRLKLVLVRRKETQRPRSQSPSWHLRLVGDREHAWCGAAVGSQWEEKRESYGEELFSARDLWSRPTVCERCAEEFERLKREVEAAERVAGGG
jgi:hypothetical protein